MPDDEVPLGHFEIVCPVCRKRVGGCRCIGPGVKQTLVAKEPCEDCKAAPPPKAA